MLKLEPRCGICQEIKKEYRETNSSKLERRINNCRKFNDLGEPQSRICRDYGFAPLSMNKHLKMHQNPDDNALIENNMERNITKAASRTEIRNELAEIGMEQLKNGEIKMNAATIRAVLKDQDDIELKQKDQAIKVMETIAAFMAGEVKNELPDPADAIQGSIIEVKE
jgi:hypothetical protein